MCPRLGLQCHCAVAPPGSLVAFAADGWSSQGIQGGGVCAPYGCSCLLSLRSLLSGMTAGEVPGGWMQTDLWETFTELLLHGKHCARNLAFFYLTSSS